MIEQLRLAQAWFDVRAFRERIVLGAALIAVTLLLLEGLWWGPARERLTTAGRQLDSLEAQRTTLQDELDTLDEREALDPDTALRRQLDKLARDIGDLDEKLRQQAVQILAPDQMPLVLRDLIDSVEGLRLLGMRTEGPQRLVNTSDEELPALYRHGLVIDLEGDYLALLAYVRALEQLPWRFYWQGVDVRAEAPGPRSFRLHIYTVSLREEWIRV